MDYVKLEAWRKCALELSRIKEEEMCLRKEVFASAFVAATEGANKLVLQGGWELKATVPYTRTLDQAKVAEILKELKKAKAPSTLIKTKYELSVTDYKKLEMDDAVRSLIDSILTTKPVTAALELIPPKGM